MELALTTPLENWLIHAIIGEALFPGELFHQLGTRHMN
ncbi:hypothetical protein X769_23805 [Mesorhizobium sp. LSJC268A00]|nr:hypothetical protein X771_30600 [Mesorhizobium sp. LSJC277A00]ESW80027.1 hypothetical protein X773_16775 [Mesorhizobium sp. LSJC285A00]ESW99272.1 hypothetical protein X769_23805 [Mesorhizobium sp. LSJC268A00]ESX09621.1 hypothetical protein X766_33375 [Mesorhizobium sp. LSJC255A00]ESX26558.1 hypothetical protein X767_04550 [Mesorhizobium sp. LSJC264A00]ESZ12865.1 hypothetical protein X735_20490 [Mesorhizobium sp. L2C085B000]ESZ35757.1 hypothetical protein X731_30490 [Mesorhizobium sp. L2C05